jgi:predicted amidohydrolase
MLKLALAQIDCELCDKQKNLDKLERATKEAQKNGADLLVLPELSLTGYLIKDRVYELAEPIPGPAISRVARIAKESGLHIVFGMPEAHNQDRGILFNTAVLVKPDGGIEKYQKVYLPTHSVFDEKRYFRPGNRITTFKTNIGTIGVCICYDLYFPEVCRILKLKGADLIVAISASPITRKKYFEALTLTRALENTVPLVFVNRVGFEEGLQFWGGSRILTPMGETEAVAKDREELLFGEVDFHETMAAEVAIPTIRDARLELLEELKNSFENF